MQRKPEHQPVSAKKLAESLSPRAWWTITWRESSSTALTSRFAALRVRPAHRNQKRSEPWPEEWLLIEWPKSAKEPNRYWLSNLPSHTAVRDLVHTTKAPWLIERNHQEFKQEIGLGHYEGRGWHGFHHHASLCSAAYGFLMAKRCPFPPQCRFTRRSSPYLRHPRVSGHAALPIRSERHAPHSTSTVRCRRVLGLVRSPPHCPCCLQPARNERPK